MKVIKFFVLFAVLMISLGDLQAKLGTHTLLDAVLVVNSGTVAQPLNAKKTFHATGFTSTGAGAATVLVLGSNDGTNFVLLDTLSLTLSSTVNAAGQDFYIDVDSWKYIRGDVSAISGTDAQATLIMASEL